MYSIEPLAFRVQRQAPSLVLSAGTKGESCSLLFLSLRLYLHCIDFLPPENGGWGLSPPLSYLTSAVRTFYEGGWLAFTSFKLIIERDYACEIQCWF
jgi:hypothetical protein